MSKKEQLLAGKAIVLRAGAAIQETNRLIVELDAALAAKDFVRFGFIADRLREINEAIEADHLEAAAIIKKL